MAHPTEVVLDAGGRIAYVLPGYPLSLREELEESIRKILGLAPPPAASPGMTAGPPQEALAAWNLGRQFLAKRDPERAREAFRAAAAVDPSSPEAPLMVARISLALGSPAEAEELVRQVGAEMLGRGDLRYLLGNLMLFKGDLGAAERTFRALQERLPGQGWGAWGLGMVALARGEHRGALAFLEAASRAQAENLEAEAFVRRHFRDRYLRQEPIPEEEGFIRIFPALAELKERYLRVFAPHLPAEAPGQ
jgi:tetratricopeptide (TPR) repeat protein